MRTALRVIGFILLILLVVWLLTQPQSHADLAVIWHNLVETLTAIVRFFGHFLEWLSRLGRS